MILNHNQAEKLADFFFDIAKGLILGGFGFASIVPNEVKLIYPIVGSLLAFWCVKLGLKLLEDMV